MKPIQGFVRSSWPQMLLVGRQPLLMLLFWSQVTFWKRPWRQRRRASVECTLTFLSGCMCVSWYFVLAPRSSFGEEWVEPHQLPEHHPVLPWNRPTGEGGCEVGCCGEHGDLLWAGLSQLWGLLTVSRLVDNPPLATPTPHADICPAWCCSGDLAWFLNHDY